MREPPPPKKKKLVHLRVQRQCDTAVLYQGITYRYLVLIIYLVYSYLVVAGEVAAAETRMTNSSSGGHRLDPTLQMMVLNLCTSTRYFKFHAQEEHDSMIHAYHRPYSYTIHEAAQAGSSPHWTLDTTQASVRQFIAPGGAGEVSILWRLGPSFPVVSAADVGVAAAAGGAAGAVPADEAAPSSSPAAERFEPILLPAPLFLGIVVSGPADEAAAGAP